MHTKAPLKHFTVPDSRFQHVHIDLVGPLPISKGFKYVLTVICRYTRWAPAEANHCRMQLLNRFCLVSGKVGSVGMVYHQDFLLIGVVSFTSVMPSKKQ